MWWMSDGMGCGLWHFPWPTTRETRDVMARPRERTSEKISTQVPAASTRWSLALCERAVQEPGL